MAETAQLKAEVSRLEIEAVTSSRRQETATASSADEMAVLRSELCRLEAAVESNESEQAILRLEQAEVSRLTVQLPVSSVQHACMLAGAEAA